MSEYMWGTTYSKPSRKIAKKMDRICIDAGGYGFNEVNVKPGTSPGINGGRYQGWFCGPNKGNPFDQWLSERVSKRINEEC